MSCVYPSCYMGSHGCPYESECDKEIERANKYNEEMTQLKLEEQRLKVEILRKENTRERGN